MAVAIPESHGYVVVAAVTFLLIERLRQNGQIFEVNHGYSLDLIKKLSARLTRSTSRKPAVENSEKRALSVSLVRRGLSVLRLCGVWPLLQSGMCFFLTDLESKHSYVVVCKVSIWMTSRWLVNWQILTAIRS